LTECGEVDNQMDDEAADPPKRPPPPAPKPLKRELANESSGSGMRGRDAICVRVSSETLSGGFSK
jgi:hypothetical protein